MKKALSYKILFLIITFLASVAIAFCFYGVNTAFAADVTESNLSVYFSGAEKFELKDGNLVATVKKNGNHSIEIANKLVVDDLKILTSLPANVSSYKVVLTYDSYYVNGAYNQETQQFDETITNEFNFDKTVDEVAVTVSVSDNVLTVNGETKAGDYYKIKGADKSIAKIRLEFTLTDESETAISVIYIDQKQSDVTGDYKQTFALDEETGAKIKTFAKPRVNVSNLPMTKSGDKLLAFKGNKYTLSFDVYSVFKSVESGDVYVEAEEDKSWIDPSTETPKSFSFKDGATKFTLRTSDKILENYEITLKEFEDDTKAPEYIDYDLNTDLYLAYQKLVEQAAVKDYGTDGKHSIRLGDSYEIPSLQDLVTDDYDVYSNLTYTVYYKTPSSAESSTASLKFTVSEAGKYVFYVVFKDRQSNSMEKDGFYTVDEDDENDIAFGHYVFSFVINDDAPMSVEAPAEQGIGYLNTRYVASGFTVKSSGNNVTYKLYYNSALNAEKDAEGWVEIPEISEIAADYNDNGFTYEDVSNINYDGEYTFTPVKIGSYKIECTITSDNAVRSQSASTVISVSEEQKVVKPDTHWFKNNLWSLIFLSVGTLSLIGIIVLLFVKPKDVEETDETGEALKVNLKK